MISPAHNAIRHVSSTAAPIVSVIIPTYNGGRYITQTIESVLSQTYRNFEIIVIDDGSTQDLSEIMRQYSRKIIYIYTKNRGPAAARNLGIRLSRGEYIALLDHDDVWSPENIERKLLVLEENLHSGMVYSDVDIIDKDNRSIPSARPEIFPSGYVFRDFLEINRIATFSATIIRKKVFNAIGLLDERKEVMTCDDYDLWLRISKYFPVLFSDDKCVHYRIHESNLIQNVGLNLNAHLLVFSKAIDCLIEEDSWGRKDIQVVIQRHLFGKYICAAWNYYNTGYYSLARKLFVKSLRERPWMVHIYPWVMLCLLPDSCLRFILGIKRDLASHVKSGLKILWPNSH